MCALALPPPPPPNPAHVPHVATTLPAPWPDARATRGMLAARSAPFLDHVPRVASHRTHRVLPYPYPNPHPHPHLPPTCGNQIRFAAFLLAAHGHCRKDTYFRLWIKDTAGVGDELGQRVAHKPEWLVKHCGNAVEVDEEVDEEAQGHPDDAGVEDMQDMQVCSCLVTWPAPPPPRRLCHTWHARRSRRPCRRTCHAWPHSARAAPWRCMPHVACTPHAPPLPAHVPRVASLLFHPAHVPRVVCQLHPGHVWHLQITLPRVWLLQFGGDESSWAATAGLFVAMANDFMSAHLKFFQSKGTARGGQGTFFTNRRSGGRFGAPRSNS